MGLATPVAFLVFNRPETTEQVFAAIRQAQPETLLLVADGPRTDRPGEAELCAKVRGIVEQIDWPCRVLKNYSEVNMGCKVRISSGLDWVFSEVEEAIILEDDCLPHPSFFFFCQEMLDRYRNNDRVMMIAGTNFLFGEGVGKSTYFFSNICSIWGWATWHRAWYKREVDLPEFDAGKIHLRYGNRQFSNYLVKLLRGAVKGKIDTWDIQWVYSIIENNGLCVTPLVNQIKNIGYQGAHASGVMSPFFNMPTNNINFDVFEPSHDIASNTFLDSIAMNNLIKYNKHNIGIVELLFNRLKKEVKKVSRDRLS